MQCDGRRPRCTRCEGHSSECVYDVIQEGMTRMQSMQKAVDDKTEDHRRLMSFLELLRYGSDHEAAALLARLRFGESIDSLVAAAEATQEDRSRYVLPC